MGQVGQLSTEAAAVEKKKEKPVDTGGQVKEQVTVDTESANEKDTKSAANEEIPANCILLSIEGCFNGLPVKFLIDSGATDCFVSTEFVENKELDVNKSKEKVKINLADGTTRALRLYIKQACVEFEEHREFIDFTVINIPNYEAILGQSWLDRWNPAINWKDNSLQWKVGKRMVKVTRVSKAQTAENASSLFDLQVTVESISAQRMRKIAKREPVYLMVIRTNEDARNAEIEENKPTNDAQIVTVNEETTKTEYPVQVQQFLNEFEDIFPKSYLQDYPRSVSWIIG